ncbi:hypothetical protein CP061683_0157B, partial [Chlamydia psittaci 06-1683]
IVLPYCLFAYVIIFAKRVEKPYRVLPQGFFYRIF